MIIFIPLMALAFLVFLGNPKLLYKLIVFLCQSIAWVILIGSFIIMIAVAGS